MKISADDQKGIGVILLYSGLLFFLIGMAGHAKADFHYRSELFTVGLTVAIVLALLGVIMILIGRGRKET
jgi:hypothetical protein